MSDDRRTLHVYLTATAHRRWHDTAAEEGVTVTGLLEALAERMDEGLGDARPVFNEIVIRARKIDSQRRRRRRH